MGNPNRDMFITDLDGATLNLRPGVFPRSVEWDDRIWQRDVAKLNDEGVVEAYHYVVKGRPDYPEVLCVWGAN